MEKVHKSMKKINRSSNGDTVYAMGLVGAAIFYVNQASGLGEVVVALLKALVWPAYFVYHVLGL